MQIQKVIEQLGYTAKEAKIYLAALSLGEAHISDIAEKVKMPRSSVQVTADKLHKDGLMNFYVMRRYKYWVAENPERLLARLKQQQEVMREAMPALFALKNASRRKQPTNTKIKTELGLFRVLADSSPQPIIIANENIEIQYVNTAWEKLFGYSLKEIHGKNPRILKSGKTPDEVYRHMWSALHAEKMFQTEEIIDKRKDGTFFSLLTTIFPIRHNGFLFYIQILDDNTERKQVEVLKQKFLQGGN